jgi:hypothetical protein
LESQKLNAGFYNNQWKELSCLITSYPANSIFPASESTTKQKQHVIPNTDEAKPGGAG